jgi:hypothetical protein
METVLNRRSNAETLEESSLIGIDRISVGEVELGEKFPSISNARVRPSGSGEGVASRLLP